jgi:hypothetical protein
MNNTFISNSLSYYITKYPAKESEIKALCIENNLIPFFPLSSRNEIEILLIIKPWSDPAMAHTDDARINFTRFLSLIYKTVSSLEISGDCVFRCVAQWLNDAGMKMDFNDILTIKEFSKLIKFSMINDIKVSGAEFYCILFFYWMFSLKGVEFVTNG